MTKKHPIKRLTTQTVWQNPWYSLRRDTIRLPDGTDGEYTIVERTGAVFVVPLCTDGRVALIKHYRYTVQQWLWEVPAGTVEPDATLTHTAHRELMEEVGGQAHTLTRIGDFFTMPGISDERSVVFLARGVQLGEPDREATEVMQTHLFPVGQVFAMLQQGVIRDGPSALALWMCKTELDKAILC
jgi:ADP-ribose pyrophosphatase